MSTCGYFERESNSQIGETGKHLIHDVAVYQIVVDVCFGLLLEGWYVILRLMSHKAPSTSRLVTMSASL